MHDAIRHAKNLKMTWFDAAKSWSEYVTAGHDFSILILDVVRHGFCKYCCGVAQFDTESRAKNTVWHGLLTIGTRFKQVLARILTRFDMADIPSTYCYTRFAAIADDLGHGCTRFAPDMVEHTVVHALHLTRLRTLLKTFLHQTIQNTVENMPLTQMLKNCNIQCMPNYFEPGNMLRVSAKRVEGLTNSHVLKIIIQCMLSCFKPD